MCGVVSARLRTASVSRISAAAARQAAFDAERAVRDTLSALEELQDALKEARQALEDFIERPEISNSLSRCADRLHEAHGALKLTEVEGGALLADEMEQVAHFLLKNPTDSRRRTEGLDALTRSMVQLPIYIERLLGGGRDIALVLLTMLNDLRAARGEPLLSEGTLLLLNLSPSRSDTTMARPGAGAEDPVTVARRLRPKFQLALLGWIKGGNSKPHLETLSKVWPELSGIEPEMAPP